jgi:hypothetical protein
MVLAISTSLRRDGADMDISEINVPTVLAFRVSAAGELGHPALKGSCEW